MTISSRTPEGTPGRCPICGADVRIEPSNLTGDAPCPQCGALLWFKTGVAPRSVGVGLPSAIGFIAAVAVMAGIVATVVIGFSYFGWTGRLGLGPSELTIIIVLGILLFGRQLPKTGRYFGSLIVGRIKS